MHLIVLLVCILGISVNTSTSQTKIGEELGCSENGFICTGGTRVQQCVDNVPQGPEFECGHGFVCDAEALPGPCVPSPKTCCAEGIFPVPGSCRTFTQCITNGERLLQYDGSCATGYEFSPEKLKCLPRMIAGCSIIQPYPSSIPTTSSTSKTTSEIPQKTTAPTLTTTKSTEFKCTSPGDFADPTSCRHYIVCTWITGNQLKATRTPCMANLLYDTSLRQCVYSTSCGSRSKKI